MKNILILTGSARDGSNSNRMADAFAEGARASGHTVNKFDTARKKIYGCIACDTCWSKGHACSLEDDFRELEPLLGEAEVLVLATPLYWFGFSAQMKAAIDKLYAFGESRTKRRLKIRQSVLLMSAGCEGQDVFDGAVATYQKIAGFSGWHNAGILTVDGINDKSAVTATNALAKAKQMGAAI